MENPSIEHNADEALLVRRMCDAAPEVRRAAETELYRRLAPRVRLYGLRHLRDEHAAADLMQQVLLMTLERIRAGKLREPDRLASYVFGMCRMVVLEIRRGGARRERLLQTFGEDLAMADAAVSPRFDQERLLHCMDDLPERERAVVMMSFFDEKPSAEVAGALGLSAGNVRVIRHRAIERLRDCVTGEGARA
ncbi:MAG: sigma-70 family RNA polymerase sigma factor [Burkholderiales bacterium]|nr:sigma-70 family RNA polymerase sigma factor [Burkholderiales bacterium]